MPTPYDVPASILIERVAERLRNSYEVVKPPDWALYVKTGQHAERAPDNLDWWYIRCASLLRKVYLKGPLGVEKLRAYYGGRKDCGVKPEHKRKGSGAIIRVALKQLESAGLIGTQNRNGRIITPQGRRILDLVSTEIRKASDKKVTNL